MSDHQRIIVGEDGVGRRLDSFLAAQLGVARSQIRKWVVQRAVEVNDKQAKPATILDIDDVIAVRPPIRGEEGRLEPEDGVLDVIYEDAHLVVIDKAAGIAVHPGAGRSQGTLSHILLGRYPELAAIGGPGRPGIVHRLDLDTTGALVVARSETAYQKLVADFSERRIKKHYQAIAYGRPQPPLGVIDLPIGRKRGERKKMAIVPNGRPSKTHYQTLSEERGLCRLVLDLETGRTHQIRVHLKAKRHPLVGDPLYGEARWKQRPVAQQKVLKDFPRPALHAWRLAFKHPVSGEALQFEAPVPEDMRQLWKDATGRDWATLTEG